VSNIKAICYVIHLIQLNPTQFTCKKSLAYTHMGGMVFELQNEPKTTLHNKLQQFPKMWHEHYCAKNSPSNIKVLMI